MSNLAIFNQVIRADKTQTYLTDVLRDKKDSFVTSLVSVVTNNTMLQACEPQTIMYAAMKATALGLPVDPSLGFAYVIPYKNHGKDEAQFQMGAKGYIQLAMRSGEFRTINVRDVKEGEITGEDFLSGEMTFTKLPEEKRLKAKTVGYVAYFALVNGFCKSFYMSVAEVQAHANRFSKAVNYGPWKTDFDAMAKKTVLKALLSKFAPMSVEMQSAIKADQAVYRDESMTENYVDNQENQTDEAKDAQVEKIKAKAEAIRARAKKAADEPQEEAEAAPEEGIPAPGFDDLPEAEGQGAEGMEYSGMFDENGEYREQ